MSLSDADVPPEFVRMYFEHQYQRMAILEQHGFTVSNLVTGACLLALGWAAADVGFDPSYRAVLLAMVTFLNVIAIVYLARVYVVKRSHQRRAKTVLDRYATALLGIDTAHSQPKWLIFKRGIIQSYVHVVIILTSLVLLTTE